MAAAVTHLVLVLVLLTTAMVSAIDYDKLWGEYEHVPTTCESPSCVSGGCLYENCEQPVSCKGGMCFFRCDRSMCWLVVAAHTTADSDQLGDVHCGVFEQELQGSGV